MKDASYSLGQFNQKLILHSSVPKVCGSILALLSRTHGGLLVWNLFSPENFPGIIPDMDAQPIEDEVLAYTPFTYILTSYLSS